MRSMLVRSPLASYSFTSDKGANIHVCYQAKGGNIGQSFYDDRQGWHPGTNGVVGLADLNNGFGVTGWDGGNEERVYYLDKDDSIVERCHSSDQAEWYDGELTGMFTAAHYSSIAAVSFLASGTLYIRVYCQGSDNKIRELCRDGSNPWVQGKIFEAAIPGTSIAVSNIPGKEWYLWLFYQRPDTTFVEQLMQGKDKWKQGIFKSDLTYDPGAYITCSSYAKDDHRVFTVDRGNNLCVTEWNAGASSWTDTKPLVTVVPQGPAAAVPVPGNIPWVRVYVQVEPSQIAEWGTNDGKNYSAMASKLPTSA